MPLLYSLGQHSALEAIQRHTMMTSMLSLLTQNGSVRSTLPCSTSCGCILACALMVAKRKFRMQLDRSRACVMDQVARGLNPEAKVWRGSELPTHKQGMKVLGTLLGHPDHVAAQ